MYKLFGSANKKNARKTVDLHYRTVYNDIPGSPVLHLTLLQETPLFDADAVIPLKKAVLPEEAVFPPKMRKAQLSTC
jgi:hypothetical protein